MDGCVILVADDDSDWVNRVENKLRKEYPLFHTATEVNDALNKIDEVLFDIIFCDIKMRYIDKDGVTKEDGGFRVAESASTLIPDVKIIMITAYGSSSYARQSFKEGAYDYLEKSEETTKEDVKAIRSMIEKILQEKEKAPIAPNPFTIEEGKRPKHFICRKSGDGAAPDYNTFISGLSKNTFDTNTPHHFLILGAAGTGKTSLFKHYRNFIQKKGSIVSYLNIPELPEKSDPRETVSSLLLGIVNGFTKYEVSHFKRFVAKLDKLGVKLGPIGFNIGVQKGELDIATIIREGLVGISKDLEGDSDIIGVFIDNLQNIKRQPEILEIILNALSSTDLAEMPILLGVSCLPDDWPLFTKKQSFSIARRAFLKNKLLLSNFSESENSELIGNTLFNTGVTFVREVIKEIFERTEGHPFNVQLLCSNLYENQIGGIVDKSVFRKAFNKTLEDIETYHFRFLSELSNKEIALLRILANAKSALTSKEIDIKLLDIERKDLISESEDILNTLQEKHVISVHVANGADPTQYYIENKMLQEYVQKSPTKRF